MAALADITAPNSATRVSRVNRANGANKTKKNSRSLTGVEIYDKLFTVIKKLYSLGEQDVSEKDVLNILNNFLALKN